MREIAIKAAKEAGKFLMDSIDNLKLVVRGSNPTTKADIDSEKIIIKTIKEKYPNHAFLGEELGKQESKSEYKWVIDPIDGTNNYVEGRDTFSVSIALEYKGKVILGVVYLPKRKELFVAEKGKGATLNGNKIKVSNQIDLSKAVISSGSIFLGKGDETDVIYERAIRSIPNLRLLSMTKTDSVFGRGSMAAEFCYTACGRIDGVLRLKQNPWDVAAGQLIAEEAGAKMVNLKGKKTSIYEGDYIAANPKLLPKIMKVIKK